MQDVSCKRMKLLILCVTIYGLLAEGPGQVLSIDRWKDQVVAPEFLLDDREDIASSRNAFFYEDKRSFRPEGLGEQVKRIAGAEDVDGLQPRLITRSLQCTCESEYEKKDLGNGHYPQYLTMSTCIQKACHKFNPCRLLHYLVPILKQRDLNNDSFLEGSEFPEVPLPEALHHNWQLKRVKIPVACVPIQDRRD